MNKFESVTRPLMWLMALLMTALVTGCGGGGGGGGATILGSPTLAPGLISLAVTPATASTPVSGTQQYTATATYSDGSSRDVTTTSAWSTSGASAANATIGAATGLATGVTLTAAGVPVIINAAFGGKTATANLNVNAATSVSFKVTPTTATIPVGGTQQFVAIQTFSDGTTIDRTATSAWSKSGASAANATVGAATGLATGVTVTPAGVPVIINASFGALVATPATLIVTAAAPVSFVVTPTTASIPVGGTQQFAAIQTFSDGTTIDRTAASTWSKSGASAANATVGAATGLATGVTVTPAGVPVVINATFGALVATPANLTVNAATSVSFVVKPATASIPVGGTQQFAAIETFSDGTTFDRTTTSAWTNSGASAANATLSVDGATGGRATGATVTPVGTPVVVNATFGAKVATPANLSVTAATVTSINVTPAAASILIGRNQQYTATAILSDGSSLDVTNNVGTTWASATPGVAANPINGLATGLTVGTSNITATYSGKTSPAAGAILTVTAPNTGPAGALPNLKTVAPFGVMAWDAMTINAGSHIYGDVALPGGVIASVVGPNTKDGGVAPNLTASAVTNSAGVTPGQINTTNNGTLTPAQLTQLQADLNSVYTTDLLVRAAPVTALTTIASARNVPGGTFAAATDLSGYVLSPGIYTTTATYGLSNASGPLVLDAGGNADAVFIIRSTSAASGITSTTGSVVLQNGAQAKNVFWVMANATIGGGTFFQGTLVAGNVITLNTFAIVQGRMLAGALGLVSGAITLSGTNIITVPQ